MKKRLLVLVCGLILLTLCGCQKKKTEFHKPVRFYYCNNAVSFNSSEGVIRSEIREAEHFSSDPEKMLREYLLGPQSEELVSPIPPSTQLVSFELQADSARITLSKPFADLNGIKLSTACSCIVKTLAEYVPITEVQIYAEDSLIDNKDFIVITVADIVLADLVEQKG